MPTQNKSPKYRSKQISYIQLKKFHIYKQMNQSKNTSMLLRTLQHYFNLVSKWTSPTSLDLTCLKRERLMYTTFFLSVFFPISSILPEIIETFRIALSTLGSFPFCTLGLALPALPSKSISGRS